MSVRLMFRWSWVVVLLSAVVWSASVPTLAQDDDPSSGPTGEIVFISYRDGDSEIFVVNADGTNLRQLTENSTDDYGAVWSPDGQQIAYIANKTSLNVMRADGSDAHQLAVGTYITSLLWSPDGQYIAYTNNATEVRQAFLALVNVATGDEQILLEFAEDAFLSLSDWSPDGSMIAFIDGSAVAVNNPRQRLLLISEGAYPVWSPDGSMIAFQSDRTGTGGYEVFVSDVDGSNRRQVTEGPNGAYEPDWSPDGQYLAYHADRGNGLAIYVIPIDGGLVSTIIPIGRYPQWSPAGGSLAPPITIDAANATPPDAAAPIELGEIVITNTNVESVLAVDRFDLPNCAGSGVFSITRTLEKETERRITFEEGAISGSEAGASFFGLFEASAREEVQKFFGTEEGETISESIEVTMEAQPGTTVTYEIEWLEVSTSGVIEITQGDTTYFVPFTIVNSLTVRPHPPYQTVCE